MTIYEFPSPATLREPPEFTLYADGHAIYMQEHEGGGFELRHAQLDDTAMTELINSAIGVLRDANESYEDIALTDMSYTDFGIRTPELTKSVWVYALGEWDEQAPSASDRATLLPLRRRLLNFAADVRAGNALDLGPYRPAEYLVELNPAHHELPDRIDWPWPTLDVNDFVHRDPRTLSRVMTPIELRLVLPEADGDHLIAPAPNGDRYVINITPLLPDQEEA